MPNTSTMLEYLVSYLSMNDTDNLLMVYCTCPDREAALDMANSIIDEKLAACVNIVPGLTSIYRWQGQRQQGSEELLLIKTTAGVYSALEKHITNKHPYELPEIIAVPIKAGLPAYLDWVRESCTVSPHK